MNRRSDAIPIALGGFAILLFLVFLHYVVQWDWISRWVLAPPGEVIVAVWQLTVSGVLPEALLISLAQVAVGVVLVSVFGLLAGYYLFKYPVYGRAYETWLGNLFAVPIILLYPIFLVVFGRGAGAIIAVAFIHCIIPVIIGMREGLMSVPRSLINVGRSFRLTESEMFWKVMLPYSLPTVFVGLRLALIYVLVYVVGIEFLISFGGLGKMISSMYFRFEIVNMYAVITFVIIISTSFYFLLKGVEQWLRRVR